MNNKKQRFVFYPINTLAITFILFLSGCGFTTQNNDWAIQDLEYIYRTVQENHPGIYNPLDPDFPKNLKTNYKTAHNQLMSAQSDADRKNILKKFINSFNDTHLQINFFEQKKQQEKYAGATKQISLTRLDEHRMLITVPTFEPNEAQKKEFQELYQVLPKLRSANTLVFDIRGNSGGNSEYAKNIVASLFGSDYACTHINKMNADVTVDWRASTDNLMHLLKFKQENELNFDPNGEFMIWLSSIIDGMQKALETEQPFYTEKEGALPCDGSNQDTHPVQADIFVIIDHNCVSAALDFIDYLKAMQHSVTLVGETTKADSLYMEIRTIELPSKKGIFAIPIKVYRNRPRGHNQTYKPDIYWDTKQNSTSLHNVINSKL